jgi:hypothetical protein
MRWRAICVVKRLLVFAGKPTDDGLMRALFCGRSI